VHPTYRHHNLTASAIASAKAKASCGVKSCTACGVRKELSDFPNAKLGIGGKSSWCKICTKQYARERQAEKFSDTIFRVNKAILKRQEFGSETCLLSDEIAYRAAAHLLDEFGLMDKVAGAKFRSLFSANRPEKLKKVSERATHLASAAVARSEKRLLQAATKVAEKAAKRGHARTMELTASNLDKLVYERLRLHLKKQRRTYRSTSFSFTVANFAHITGYRPSELRSHLHEKMPVGKTWADVVAGSLHIEHVIPAAAFDLTTVGGVRRCYALANLTLLPATENAVKGATQDKQLIAHFRGDIELARLFGLAE
jgi:hypothetical protein